MGFLSALFYCTWSACVLSKTPKRHRDAKLDMENGEARRQRFLNQRASYLSGRIISITDDNFDKIIADNPRMLIAFTSPSCPGCQQWIDSDFQRVSDKLAEAQPPVVCGEVSDRTLSESLHMEVEDVPRLLFFKDEHKFSDIHPSKMTAKGIIKWINSKLHENAAVNIRTLKILSSVDETRDYLRTHQCLVLGCFKDKVPEAYQKVSKELAHASNAKFAFSYTQAPEVAQYFNVKVPGLMLFIPGDEETAHFRGNLNHSTEITSFINSYLYPAVREYNGPQTLEELKLDGRPAFICVTGPGEDGKFTREAFVQTALKINRRMIPVHVRASESWVKEVGELLGRQFPCQHPDLMGMSAQRKDREIPCKGDLIAIVEALGDRENQRIFKLELSYDTGPANEDQIVEFAHDYMADNLPEFAKNDL